MLFVLQIVLCCIVLQVIVICFILLRAIFLGSMKLILSGMVQWLVYCGMGGEGTITAALNGDDVKQGIYLQKLMFEAIMRNKILSTNYVQQNLTNTTICELELLHSDVTEENVSRLRQTIPPMPSSSGDMSFWMDMYLEVVNLMLNMVHFQRIRNWNGYLQALGEFLPYCFSLNRHNYARNLSYYRIQMLNLHNSNPNLLHHMQEQGFTVSLSDLPYLRIPCDQVIEMTINQSSKDTGGLSGKTENVGASERWMRINHIMAALREHLDL